MKRFISRIDSELRVAKETYRVRSSHAKAIVLFPFTVVFLWVLFMTLPATRFIALWILKENHPVELFTFLFLLMGGIGGLVLVWHTGKRGERRLVSGFYAAISVGLLLTAMEEVAWGQWFFGFETPSLLKERNIQDEFTFHNLRGLQGHSEFFRIAFGLGGLVGVLLFFHKCFRKIGVPIILLPYFLIITVLSGMDLYNDYFPIRREIDVGLQRLSELVEMLIGVSGFLFIWLNARMLVAEWKEKVPRY